MTIEPKWWQCGRKRDGHREGRRGSIRRQCHSASKQCRTTSIQSLPLKGLKARNIKSKRQHMEYHFTIWHPMFSACDCDTSTDTSRVTDRNTPHCVSYYRSMIYHYDMAAWYTSTNNMTTTLKYTAYPEPAVSTKFYELPFNPNTSKQTNYHGRSARMVDTDQQQRRVKEAA